MVSTFEDYLAAHEDFLLVKPRTEKYGERIGLYVMAEHGLKERLAALELLADNKNFDRFKAAMLSKTGSKVFFKVKPKLAEIQKEIDGFRSAYRNITQPSVDEFAQRACSYPLCSTAVDVLTSKGLQVIITPLHGVSGTSDNRNYRLSLDHRLKKDQVGLTVVHELCHMFYGGTDILPELTQIGAESPLEEAIDMEAAAVLKREPQLAGYAMERGRKRIVFSGFTDN